MKRLSVCMLFGCVFALGLGVLSCEAAEQKTRTLTDANGIWKDAVFFGEADEFAGFVSMHDTISVTYYPEINEYQGRRTLQVVIRNYC